MKANKPTTVWWVEPNHIPGVHKIRASVWYMSGRTIEVSHLVPQNLLDSVIVPRWYVGRIISNMQAALNGAITGSGNHGKQ